MHHYSLLQLREIADQLSIVAQILETNPFYLRSKQIRQVDKALLALENFITPEIGKEARHWKESFEGLLILNKKLNSMDNTQVQISQLDQEIAELKILTRSWCALENAERDQIIQQTKEVNEFLKNKGNITEASVIDRYNRSLELQNLMIYADKAPHLCDTIFHHTQKERYTQNLLKLQDRIAHVNTQMKIIKRGFWVALVLCLLVATIPICLPFAVTLWQKKQRLEGHLTIYKNIQRREHRRVELAEEGYAVVQEIKILLGEVSYEAMKNLLMEVKELKGEFYSQQFQSASAMILNYIDTNKYILTSLLGPIPEPRDRFEWLVKNVNKLEIANKKLESLEDLRRDLCLQKKQTTKGYERGILTKSIDQLQLSMASVMQIALSDENKVIFAEMCIQVPDIFKKIRETIYLVTQNNDIDLHAWNTLASKIEDYARKLAFFVLDAEITEHKNNQETHMNMTIPSAAIQNLNEETSL